VPTDLVRADLDVHVVSPGYIDSIGTRLVSGRAFPEGPSPGDCRVGIVNREAADLYFNGRPLGASVIDERGRRTAIIGVVESERLGTFQLRPQPALYLPMWQDAPLRMTVLVPATDVTREHLDALLHKIEAVPGRGPFPPTVTTLPVYLAQTSLSPLRIATIIFAATAAI
jgi:hypothetical protein